MWFKAVLDDVKFQIFFEENRHKNNGIHILISLKYFIKGKKNIQKVFYYETKERKNLWFHFFAS